MSWETRPNGERYYTRSRQVNGRVVREYVGPGDKGYAAARIDWARRTLLECHRSRHQYIVDEIRQFETDLLILDQLVECIVRAVLHAAGYHQLARGQWRKRRVARTQTETVAVQPYRHA